MVDRKSLMEKMYTKKRNNYYDDGIIVMKINQFYIFKLIIGDDCGYRGPAHFAKTRMCPVNCYCEMCDRSLP